jgi:hypothetical protein
MQRLYFSKKTNKFSSPHSDPFEFMFYCLLCSAKAENLYCRVYSYLHFCGNQNQTPITEESNLLLIITVFFAANKTSRFSFLLKNILPFQLKGELLYFTSLVQNASENPKIKAFFLNLDSICFFITILLNGAVMITFRFRLRFHTISFKVLVPVPTLDRKRSRNLNRNWNREQGHRSGSYWVTKIRLRLRFRYVLRFFLQRGGGSDFTCVMFMPIVSWKVLIITSRIDVLPLFRNSQDFHVDLWPMAHWPWSRKPAPTTTDSIVSSRMAASHPELQQVLVNTKFIHYHFEICRNNIQYR